MAATVSIVQQGSAGDLRYSIADVTGDSSYPNGTGYVLTPQQFGLTSFFAMGITEPSAGYDFSFSATSGALKFYDTGSLNAVLNETTNATNVSAVTTRMFVQGK